MLHALRVLPLLFLSLAASARAAPKLLTLEDFRQVVSVRAPRISPDGKQIVYVRSRLDWKANRNRSELVLVNVDGTGMRTLTHGRSGVDDPKWSPDGTRIAFLASPEQGKPAQLFVMPMNGGDPMQATSNKAGVQDFAWRPDGTALAYVSDDDPANQKDLDKHLDAVVITDNDYLTREQPQPAHLWLVNAAGGAATRLTSGTWSVVKGSAPVWAPDGTKIYYQRQPDAIFAHLVSQTTYVYDMKSKRSADLGLGVDSDPKMCPSGMAIDGARTIIWSLDVLKPRHGTPYLQHDLSQRALDTLAEIENSKTTVDRNVHWFGCPLDAPPLIATADGVRNVLWTSTEGSETIKNSFGDVDFGPDASVSDNGAVAFVGLRRDRPGEIYYLPPGSFAVRGNPAPKQISDENAWISGYAVARSEEFKWQTDIGMQADGVLTYPVHYVAGRKYPLVLDIHGGPISTSTWDMTGLEGLTLVQVLAARDYFVFRPNYRGSDNLGDAFLQAIVGDMASGPGRDNLAAVAALRATGMIDDSRIAVSGWSGGGLQTSWLIGHASFWRAAVMGAAVTDQYEQAVLSDINEPFNQAFFNVLPFTPQGRAAYAAESPITFVDNVKTPTLILSDTRDQRVPVSQAYLFYHALRDRGVTVQFTAFPRAGHFPVDPVGREMALRAWAGWLEKWLK